MLNFIDSYLSKITMYRLALYYLMALICAAVVFSFFGVMPFKPLNLIFSTLILVVISWGANKIFAAVFKVPANVESDYISALILALIITPSHHLWFLVLAAVLAQASKYILAYRGKHVFNPAAFAVALTALTINQAASWWVGTLWMMPLVLVGGLLIARKTQRFDLVLSFLAAAFILTIAFSSSRNQPLFLLQRILVNSPVLFFAFIMLTEPATTPPRKLWRMSYGVLVGLLFSSPFHFGSVYSTPELALLVGNIFSYLVGPKQKYLLSLKTRENAGTDTYDFVFRPNRRIMFRPGQYMEWTLGHKKSDSRGNRRYFTIASSPTERNLHLGIKFYDQPSSFKRALMSLPPGQQVLAGSPAGDFVLPEDKNIKLVFLAGGIGITPFRSMLKYLLDKNERRDIVLFYSNKTTEEAVYKEVLEQAQSRLAIRTVYVMTEKTGYLTGEQIAVEAPDYKQRQYYISGPHSMVVAFKKTLKGIGIPQRQIKIDFFPGYA